MNKKERRRKKKRESAFQKSVPLISRQTLRPFTCEKKMYKNLASNGVNENYEIKENWIIN